MSTPVISAKPQIVVSFEFQDGTIISTNDAGGRPDILFSRFEFKAMANGGYIIFCKLSDPMFSIFNNFISNNYLEDVRYRPVIMRFQLKWSPESTYPTGATNEQIAYVVASRVTSEKADYCYLEFIAIDPPSWYLNAGDASGKVYTGKVSEAIKQVVNRYAPGVKLQISKTTDNNVGKWPMMRQDPKTFINSLLDWSSSLTPKKTHWIVAPNGMNLDIKEQADCISTQRAYYKYNKGRDSFNTILDVKLEADNALAISNSKIVTHGLSAVSGRYFDRITEKNKETYVFAKDSTTPNKLVAATSKEEAFTGPVDGSPPEDELCGWTSMSSIPELSGGDIGKAYGQWIDGRARGMYLNMMNLTMRAKFKVLGHGEWDSCVGLGTDTMFITWNSGNTPNGVLPFFLTGNWLVYGFHHILTRKFWTTDIYAARFDYDATAKKVGSGVING